jgi:hypothetical protein
VVKFQQILRRLVRHGAINPIAASIGEAAFVVASGEFAEWKRCATKIHRDLAPFQKEPVEKIALMNYVSMCGLAQQIGADPLRLAVDGTTFSTALYEWAHSGFPHFSLTDDFFHAVSQTDFGDPTDEPMHVPFHVFTVSFPPSAEIGTSRFFVCRTARLLSETDAQWLGHRLMLVTPDPSFYDWPDTTTRKEFLSGIARPRVDERVYRKTSEEEDEQLRNARQLLGNFLTYIEASGPLPTVPRVHGAAPLPVELVHPIQRNYVVGRPVRLDSRIREVLQHDRDGGARWKLAQRFVVRGHWRNQVYGEGRSLRKRLWIEPHWRGPDNLQQALERTYEVAL